MDVSEHFKGQRITVMGLGLLGGVSDIAYLAESGAEIIATDIKSESELKPSLDILKKYPNIRYTLGRHDLADFRDRDLIIKAPSTPLDSEFIAEAHKNDTPVTMWAALFARFARDEGVTIVGVTGTRGKSTVTAMIVAILREAGKKVIEGGNVRGTALLPQLAQVTAETVAVLELDSWKLQGWGEALISPHVAVFTTLFQDHLNYYKDNPEQYLADKANIFLYQNEEDTLVLGKQCAPTIIDRYGEAIVAKTVVADASKLPDEWQLRIPGEHNRYNAALALASARALGVSDETSRKALESFMGVPGRLELVREVNGVKVYNDTTSTTPEATLVAIEALRSTSGQNQNLILILGGADKNLDMNVLLAKLGEVKRVILLAGTGTDRIKDQLPPEAKGMIYHTFSDAVAAAFAACEPGDTLLFSPAFASFGMFKNEYDRGDQFNALVKKL